MASIEQCEAALQQLAERLAGVDSDVRRKHVLDRTLSCRVTDLDVVFTGRLRDGHLADIARSDTADGQIKLTTASDDLVALTDGTLSFPSAWASGRLKVDASMLDLLKLRSLL